jgi:hypothetical protein
MSHTAAERRSPNLSRWSASLELRRQCILSTKGGRRANFPGMVRLARAVIPELRRHVTQHGITVMLWTAPAPASGSE